MPTPPKTFMAFFRPISNPSSIKLTSSICKCEAMKSVYILHPFQSETTYLLFEVLHRFAQAHTFLPYVSKMAFAQVIGFNRLKWFDDGGKMG